MEITSENIFFNVLLAFMGLDSDFLFEYLLNLKFVDK